MSLIGQFNSTKSGYAGRVRTLVIDAELVLVPAEHSDAENAPDYRIHLRRRRRRGGRPGGGRRLEAHRREGR